MDEREVMRRLEETGALLNGHFELRSGLHSNCFFQCANALRYPAAASELCGALVEKTVAELGGLEVDGVISPALGGIIVGHEVARALGVKSIFAEKQDGRLAMRRFSMGSDERYVVAEDVVTRGGRVQESIDLVREAGAHVAAVVVLVDRSAGEARFDAPFFSLMRMAPEVWEPARCPLCAKGEPLVHPGS